MPRFRFILECQGIEAGRGRSGFYASRTVTAASPVRAQAIAIEQVVASWKSDADNCRPGEGPAYVQAVEAWRVPPLDFRRVPNKGAVFYDDSEEARDAALKLEREVARAPK